MTDVRIKGAYKALPPYCRSTKEILPVTSLDGVPDASQHIRNGIGHAHCISSWFSLPTGLGDTRNVTLQGELPETDTADAELAEVSPGTTAE